MVCGTGERATLFESSWKKPFGDRGIRRLLERYAEAAGLAHPISPASSAPLLADLAEKAGIDDALIQPYSGHASRQALEIYSRLAIADAQVATPAPCAGSRVRLHEAALTLRLVTRTLIHGLVVRVCAPTALAAVRHPRLPRESRSWPWMTRVGNPTNRQCPSYH